MKDIHIIKNIFIMLVVLLAAVCLYAAICSTNVKLVSPEECMEFDEGWSYYASEESVMPITELPCKLKVSADEELVVVNQIPDISLFGKYLCVLNSHQHIKVFVDDEMIYSSELVSRHPFGKSGGVGWIFIPLQTEYAGSKISIMITSSYRNYSGKLDTVYIGTKIGIIVKLFQTYGFAFVIGMMMMVVSLIFFVVYVIGRYSKFNWNNYLYLCFFTAGMAVWLICESHLGQFVIPNVFLLYIINITSLMLSPLPILMYTNDVEQNRYGREFNLMCWVFIVNFLMQMSLFVTNVCDFVELTWVTHILIAMIFITTLISLFVCYKEKKIQSIKNNFEGLLTLFVFCIVESVNYYCFTYRNLGNYVSVGVVFYVLILSHGSTTDRLNQEREKIMAVSQNQAKTNFLARMSHEIRTPMNAIIGMNDMILNENINEDVRKYAVNIQNSANVMMALLSDVLDFSKIETGKMELVNVNYQLFNLLRDVIGITSVTAQNKRLKFIYEINENIPSGYVGDEVRIRQVLLNVLNNAVKYTDSGYVKMVFHCETHGFMAWFKVSVEDTGIGIKEEELGRIFDTFERLDYEKNRKIEGFGLGLAITKQLLDLMGGNIEIQSEYGKGSIFTLRIPQKVVDRSPMEEINEENIMRNSSQKSIVEGKYAGKRILAVDDNEVNLQVVAGLLKASAIKVDGVLNGSKCLTAMARYKYDLVLMDHRMPGMDGVETLKYIRGNPINRDIPVIALTANAVEGAREDFLAEGFDDYISKPISAKKFYSLLDKYLE